MSVKILFNTPKTLKLNKIIPYQIFPKTSRGLEAPQKIFLSISRPSKFSQKTINNSRRYRAHPKIILKISKDSGGVGNTFLKMPKFI